METDCEQRRTMHDGFQFRRWTLVNCEATTDGLFRVPNINSPRLCNPIDWIPSGCLAALSPIYLPDSSILSNCRSDRRAYLTISAILNPPVSQTLITPETVAVVLAFLIMFPRWQMRDIISPTVVSNFIHRVVPLPSSPRHSRLNYQFANLWFGGRFSFAPRVRV